MDFKIFVENICSITNTFDIYILKINKYEMTDFHYINVSDVLIGCLKIAVKTIIFDLKWNYLYHFCFFLSKYRVSIKWGLQENNFQLNYTIRLMLCSCTLLWRFVSMSGFKRTQYNEDRKNLQDEKVNFWKCCIFI